MGIREGWLMGEEKGLVHNQDMALGELSFMLKVNQRNPS